MSYILDSFLSFFNSKKLKTIQKDELLILGVQLTFLNTSQISFVEKALPFCTAPPPKKLDLKI